jgi:phosphonate transport system ATP-binding protein
MAVEVYHLSKTFGSRKALDDVSLMVEPGEMVALIGSSGSGKSTFLRHICGLVASDKGSSKVKVRNQLMQENGHISSHARRVRSDLGFVFQQFNLVGRLKLLTNIHIGMLSKTPAWRSITRFFTMEEKRRAMAALHRVGMSEYVDQRASTLSGGQQQRAAIAQTIVQGAKIILADEPIASLDPDSSRRVMDLLADLNKKDGCTVVVSLHQVEYALKYCPRTIALKDGRVVYDGPCEKLTREMLNEIYASEADEVTFGNIDLPSRPGSQDAVREKLAQGKVVA